MSTDYAAQILIWIDLETTGLDPEKDQILEVACVLTKADLSEIGRRNYVICPAEPITTSRFVMAMHAKNGLWDECTRTGDEAACDLDHVDMTISQWLAENGVGLRKGLIAGSTPQFDKAFIAKHMPATFARFNHRVFDVSTLKAAMCMWFSPSWCEAVDPAHRAMVDIEGSIAIAHAFRNHVTSLNPPRVAPLAQ